MTHGNDAAFSASASWREEQPEIIQVQNEGLSKREYFSSKIIQGLLASTDGFDGAPHFAKHVAETAVTYTDALIEALNAK